METKEFNLSEKGFPIKQEKPNIVFAEGDIREFIKKLKGSFCINYKNAIPCKICYYCKRIDKLVGDKLK